MLEQLEPLIVIAILLCVVVCHYIGSFSSSIIFGFAALILYITNILTLKEVLSGVTNEGVVTLFALILVAKILQERLIITALIARFLKSLANSKLGFVKLLAGVACISGFLNNTPVVSMLIDPVRSWGKSKGISASKLLLPVSYAAIIGGTLTLIGTSTNLVVIGLLEDLGKSHNLSLFSTSMVGIPLLVFFLIYSIFLTSRLPNRNAVDTDDSSNQIFTFEAKITSDFESKSVDLAHLRNLDNGYLYQLIRSSGDKIEVTPKTVLNPGDTLIFTGKAELISELSTIRWLQRVGRYSDVESENSHYLETIIPMGSSLVGKTAKEVGFRSRFGAVIMSVAHQGHVITGKLGDYTLSAGDSLLLEVGALEEKDIPSQDLMVLSNGVASVSKSESKKSAIIFALFPLTLISSVLFGIKLLNAVAFYLVLCWFLGFVNLKSLQRDFPTNIFITLLGALSLAKAVDKTGLAEGLLAIIGEFNFSAVLVLIFIFIFTWLTTELFTNNSAAALCLPFALVWGDSVGLSVESISLAVMVAASMSFITPYGYQTNLMVLSPGNYKPIDYLKYGFPLVVGCGAISIFILSVFM